MKPKAPTRLTSEQGVELWRLESDGAAQYAVRTGSRRARLTSSLAAAEALVARHLHLARLARAH